MCDLIYITIDLLDYVIFADIALFADIVTVVRLPVSGILHCTSFIAGDCSLAVLSSN